MQTDHNRIWQAALGELSLQMTRPTFDTWLAHTSLVASDNHTLTIAVPNAFTKDWLEDRLLTTIQRTLLGIVGHSVEVKFVVTEVAPREQQPVAIATPPLRAGEGLGEGVSLAETDPTPPVAVKFYEFDPRQRGFLQTPKYDLWFWQPLLGVVAYGTYQFLRSLDKQNTGWGNWHHVSVGRIAATLGVSHQAITGVPRRGKDGRKYWQKGAFDRLQEAGIAQVETLGSGNKNVSYCISCLNNLPLLVPAQVETLPEVLQLEHARFLKECSIEYKEWKQIELPSLLIQR